MRTRSAVWMVTLLLILLSGCKKERVKQAETKVEGSVALPQANAAAVFDYILATSDYRQWPFYPDKGVLYPGKHPHGALLITYVSPATLIALQQKEGRLPNGSNLVKESYDLQKNLQATTVMYRLDNYNPEGGDWFWLKYAPDQTILEEGKAENCIKCHSVVKDNDWIFSGQVN